MKSLFGAVPNTPRVAKFLHDRSGGSPRQFIDLAQLMIRNKLANYVTGTWVLPLEVRDDELPSRLDELNTTLIVESRKTSRAVASGSSCSQSRATRLGRWRSFCLRSCWRPIY